MFFKKKAFHKIRICNVSNINPGCLNFLIAVAVALIKSKWYLWEWGIITVFLLLQYKELLK